MIQFEEKDVWEDLDTYCHTLQKDAVVRENYLVEMLGQLYELPEEDPLAPDFSNPWAKLRKCVKSWLEKGGNMERPNG